ncbi:nSTAND1 domain-containing NTPase [Nocardioides flavus (ex Wang et al. 2016)]|uniref:nSTAND1 domain-containing NTPase n=1 Tax=Nocardioides flavus (ex Wang et al. 2016) TaxID=2058780 RepID=UPI0017482329|nr:BTAD domain-containing putative transcriptional regulator [Nocardioides flavus (ex Wang et al. 2016)]
MAIQVLGPLAVDGSGRLGPRDRVVLQALAVRQGRPVTADELADALWGDTPPASAHKNLQSCIVRLRKALGADAIETTGDGYRLVAPGDDVDARRFESQVARARELLELGEVDRVSYLLERALDLWRGPAFADLPDWPPARREAGRLEELRRDAEELLLDAQLRGGRAREALPRAHEMVRAAPLRERRWELLALAQYRTGAQGEALRTIRQLRSVLARELGIDPAPDIVALEQSILRQDPTLDRAEAPVVVATCPWQGLQAYDVDEADRFFGREGEVEVGLEILDTHGLLALVGPSGSGKSSLMRAGIGARLRMRGTRLVAITPGHYPLRALSALASAGVHDALLVDQAEELFTLCEDPDETRTFVDALVEEVSRRPVVVALRADRLADLAAYAALSRLVERGLYLVGGLDETGLRAAVEGPARQAGLLLEPGLVDLLVTEVRDDPGALPLLSHALLETWKRREGNTLTVDGYRASGGIHGAVAQSAERLYAEVEPDLRGALRDLVLRLLAPGTEGEPVRTRVPRRLVGTDTAHERLVEMLVSARLVTSDEGVLEITHESLARAWPRLRGWLEDDVDGRRILHHLSSTADAWDTLGRPDSELYRGVRLTRAVDWCSGTGASLTAVERAFLSASQARAEVEEQSAAVRAREQARLISRLRQVLAGALVLLVLAVVGGVVAIAQRDRADDNAAAAQASEIQAVARRAGASALVASDIDTSLLLAVAGMRLDPSTGTHNSLLAAITRRDHLVQSHAVEGTLALALDVSGDGRLAAILDESHRLRLYETSTGDLVSQRQMGEDLVLGANSFGEEVRFSPDGRLLAVARAPFGGRPLALLSVPDLAPATALPGLPRRGWRATDISFSQDGSRLAVALQDGSGQQLAARTGAALVWDLARPGPPTRFALGVEAIPQVSLAADGDVLFTSHPLTRHSLDTGSSRLLDPDGRHYVWAIEALDAGAAVVGIDDNTPRVFDGASGRVLGTYPAEGFVASLKVSPDGRRFAVTTMGQREVREWRLGRPDRAPRTLALDRGNANAVDYSADGAFLLAVGRAGTALRRWDLTGRHGFVRSVAQPPGSFAAFGVMAADGRRSVLLQDYRTYVTDHRDGSVATIPPQEGYRHTYGAFHPDGRRFATAVEGEVRVWDDQGELTGQRAVFPGQRITELDWTPDGTRLAVSELDGTLTLLDGETLRPVARPVEMEEPVSWVVAHPDGRSAVVLLGGVDASGPYNVPTTGWAVVDLLDGVVTARGDLGMRYGYWLDVSPDGALAVVTGGEHGDGANSGARGRLEVVDLTTGRAVAPPRDWAGDLKSQVVFSPDGTKLLTSSPNGLVGVWDAASATPVATLAVPDASSLTGAILPGGRTARILDWSTRRVVEWDLSRDSAVEFACRAVGRDLTRAEWAEHFGDLAFRETCPQ